MPIYKLRNFGKYGTVTDIPAYDLPPEAWSSSNNVRYIANRFEKMGGYTPILDPAEDKKAPMVFTQEPETNRILYATSNNIYRVRADGVDKINSLTDPSNPASTQVVYNATPESPWDYSVLSNVVVFNNPNDDPVAWIRPLSGDPDIKLVNLPNWGVPKKPAQGANPVKYDWKAAKIRSYKNYLIALNMTEEYAGTGGIKAGPENFPQRVRWSNVAYVNALPPDWYEGEENMDGGYNDLSDCYGSIVDGLAMRDFFIIYTNRETYIMKFVGGNFVFDFQKLFPDSGILNANCVTEFEGGNHFVVSEDDIFVHDGSTRTSVATDIVKEHLLDQITSVNYQATKVFAYPTRKEIWVTYTTQSSEFGAGTNYAANRAAIWNWKTGVWSFTDIPDVYWMEQVTTPTDDNRAWANPDSAELKDPTQIVLDSPIDGLPIGQNFRIDTLFKPGEGLTKQTVLDWKIEEMLDGEANTVAPADYDKYATLVKQPYDQSAILTSIAEGRVKISVTVHGSTDALLTDSYTIFLTPAELGITLRQQASDPAFVPNPGVITPRPDQFADAQNQWEMRDDQAPNKHANELWDKKGYSFSARVFISSSNDTAFYAMDTGNLWERFGGYDSTGKLLPNSRIPVISEISRFAISMSDFEESLASHKTWRTIYPMASGTGTLRFLVGGSNDPFVQPATNESIDFVIGQDQKVDCFTNYRYLSITIRDENEGEWSMSGMDVDYFLGGTR